MLGYTYDGVVYLFTGIWFMTLTIIVVVVTASFELLVFTSLFVFAILKFEVPH